MRQSHLTQYLSIHMVRGRSVIKWKLIPTHETAPLFLYRPIKLATYSLFLLRGRIWDTFNALKNEKFTHAFKQFVHPITWWITRQLLSWKWPWSPLIFMAFHGLNIFSSECKWCMQSEFLKYPLHRQTNRNATATLCETDCCLQTHEIIWHWSI